MSILRRITNLFHRSKLDEEIDAELRSHIEMRTADNIAAGMSPKEARRQAVLRFGSRPAMKERVIAADAHMFLDSLWRDLHYSLRGLRKNLGFTAIAVLTLALGIGANTAVFSVFDLDLLRPLPYANANRLVFFGMLMPSFDSRPFLFTSSYLQLRTTHTPFESITSWRPGIAGCDLTETQPLRLACARAESTFLPTFGISPILGRSFNAEEDGPNAPAVCLISYALWQSRFGGRATALGQMLSLDGQPTRIIGILPPNFEWPTLEPVDVILPEAITAAERSNPMAGAVRAYARLKPGVNMKEARAQLEPALESWRQASPPMFRKEIGLGLISVREDQVGSIRLALLVLFGASLALLLLAVANVTNLLSARASARERELAVRTALGASRRNLIALQLTESTLLGLSGGVGGAGLAFVLLRLFVALAPAGIPHVAQVRLDAPVVLFVLIASVLAGLACGLAPALTPPPVRTLLAGPSLAAPRARLGAMLVVGQVAVSFALVAGAGLLLETLRNIDNVPLGMKTSHIVTAEVTLGRAYGQSGRADEFFNQLESALRDLPGVTGVGVSDSLPPTGGGRARSFFDIRVEGQPPSPKGEGGLVGWSTVTPGYFQTLGIPILEGREFLPSDQDPHSDVIVVTKKLAARLFAGRNAIGQHLQLAPPSGSWYTVIGVVGDVNHLDQSGRIGRSDPGYYLPRPRLPDPVTAPDDRHAFFLVRSSLEPVAVERLVREKISTLDPTLLASISTLDARVNLLRVQPRFNAALITLFAALGFLLSALGLYGVLSFLVMVRTKEIGIRTALGAAPQAVLKMIVWRGLRLVLLGLAAGVVLELAGVHLLQGLLYGVTPGNAEIAVASVLLLLIAGSAACYIPARRAMRVDPMVALRHE
ncbi:MAG TPA: ABC transporter permease [Candidatus Acidoferrales bacterium]|nr:ABC transporter permease [Candidatus Acidoferrales bacterium]